MASLLPWELTHEFRSRLAASWIVSWTAFDKSSFAYVATACTSMVLIRHLLLEKQEAFEKCWAYSTTTLFSTLPEVVSLSHLPKKL